jgi:hypothetical protein
MNKPKKNFCETCGISASFNLQELTWGRFCKTHKLENMVDIKHKKCNYEGCNRYSQGNGKCKAHGGGRRCVELGCNFSAREKSDKCVTHGGGKRCSENDCTKGAEGKTDKCIKHGGGERCNYKGCTFTSRAGSNFCKTHGGGKRCSEPGCEKSAREYSDKCTKHGGGKRCNYEGCHKSAQGKTDKCVEHGGGKRCILCIDHIDSRKANKKYGDYCATCFKRAFPEDERSKVIYSHTKEIRVRNFINEHFEGFIHDKPIYTHNCDCTHRRRIDHRKLIGNTILAVETDEHAHSSYDEYDEEIRYDDVYMIYSGKWIFIRFNPDGKDVDMEDKLDKLLEVMGEQIERIEREENTDLVDIIKLFY